MEKWKAYCQAIASSEFLIKTFHQKHKLSLEWALKFDNLQRIMEGQFSVNMAFFPKTQGITISKESLIDERDHSPDHEILSMLIDGLGAEAYKSWFHYTKPQIKRTGGCLGVPFQG